VVPRNGAADVDAEGADCRNGCDADAGGDPAEPGERAVPPLHRGAPALGGAWLARSCHAFTVRGHPDAYMKI
jgi:hypothetical protein